MINGFKSKPLKELFEKGASRRIAPDLQKKVLRELDALDEAENVEQLNIPGFGLHALTGNRKEQWAMTVSRNWRITFRFENGDAVDVDFEDYH